MRLVGINKNKIVVGVSGGIDSAVALILLRQQGWDPIAVCLKINEFDNFNKAKELCQQLGVRCSIVDVRSSFKKIVLDYFDTEMKYNRTPNPCVICNPKLKFNKLFEFAKKRGIKYVATGHYARIRQIKSPKLRLLKTGLGGQAKVKSYLLLKGRDKLKDQSYYLAFLPKKWLGRIIFPLGDYTKEQIYKIARKEGFSGLINKKQSQDFCFLENFSLRDYLINKIGYEPGLVQDMDGNILGKHQGLYFYTIGQRKGINLGGGPYYVVGFEVKNNVLIVSKDEKDLYRKEAVLWPINWLTDEVKSRVKAKIRYQHHSARATIVKLSGGKLKVIFDQPQKAITPGQFAVFYDRDVCLGGGRIIS